MSKQGKHHYIPIFYLKQWVGTDQRLCEFKRRYHGIAPRRVYPDMTGYIHGLNTIPGLPPEHAQYLETHFLSATDTYASRALRILLGDGPWRFTDHERSGWSRFITSLLLRNPETVERMKVVAIDTLKAARSEIEESYAKNRLPTNPPTYDEYAAQNSPNPAGRVAAILLQNIIDSPKIGQHIINMRWRVFKTPPSYLPFLSSDRPVVMRNGMNNPDSQIVMPISPHHAFAATNTAEAENLLLQIAKENTLVQQVNERVVAQARTLVFGEVDTAHGFVVDHFGKQYIADPLDGPSPFETARTDGDNRNI